MPSSAITRVLPPRLRDTTAYAVADGLTSGSLFATWTGSAALFVGETEYDGLTSPERVCSAAATSADLVGRHIGSPRPTPR
jgi:hypothetical protein